MCLVPVVSHFNHIYGWRVTLLILSGIVMICAIFGALFRPFRPTTTKENTLLEHPHRDENLNQNEILLKKRCCESLDLDLLKNSIFVLFVISGNHLQRIAPKIAKQ